MKGPFCGAMNDGRMLDMSELVNELEAALPQGYKVFGDGAYKLQSRVYRPYRGTTQGSRNKKRTLLHCLSFVLLMLLTL